MLGTHDAFAHRRDDTGCDTGLRGAPCERAVAIVRGVDRRLVDEQRQWLDRNVGTNDDDERRVAGARRRERGRPRHPNGAVFRPEHRVDVRGVRAIAGEALTDLHGRRLGHGVQAVRP